MPTPGEILTPVQVMTRRLQFRTKYLRNFLSRNKAQQAGLEAEAVENDSEVINDQ